ncbi:COG1470 family protein [Selenihalanaerobacter shriftii]|uniref:Uncharacterized protein n=1 Tax=Selenihalanaerobacter shriftii TaxID=142842 RepID=A0A1T4JR88_9FIRM|nr:hypothetical protein [Selenihalanaerobacter shriftii]SJZ32577.1 hypothetical protein SAMN02745118_00340 [Selenihalanaerobacter shriftii]
MDISSVYMKLKEKSEHVLMLKIIIIIITILIFTQNGLAVGVKPLVIDLSMQPGDIKEFTLNLTPSGSEELVKLSLYQPVQLTNGSLTYQKSDTESFLAAKWVELENDEVKIYPGQQQTVSGRVKVPFNAGGSHTVVIMVEPQKTTQKKNGIRFMVRYAVRLNIRVDRPGLRSDAKLKDLKLTSGKEGEPIVKARLKNPSAWDYLVLGEATIRDSKRRLVERITLESKSSRKNSQTRMHPGSKVDYLGEITKRLTSGEYTLRVFFRYGDHGQIIKSKQLDIKEGDFNFPGADEIGAFTVEPKKLNLKLKPGQRKSEIIRLNSEIGENTVVVVDGSEVESKYKYSALEWLKLRGRRQFTLRGRGKGRAILTTAVPRNVEDGSYHSNINLKAYDSETKKLLTKKQVPVSIVVGKDHSYAVQARSLHTSSIKEGELLSLDLFNNGNIFCSPEAKMIIKDNEDKFVERVKLNLPEGTEEILPLKNQRITGIAKKLTPGKYTAEISIYQGKKELTKLEKEFEVLESKTDKDE